MNKLLRCLTFMALLGLSSLLLLGCPARWKIVFINGSEQSLSVQLSGSLDGTRRAVTLSQGGSHSELLGDVKRLAVFGPSGALLFQRDDFCVKDLDPPLPNKYPHIYFLLTTTSVYLIPPNYCETWREHIDEIAKPGS